MAEHNFPTPGPVKMGSGSESYDLIKNYDQNEFARVLSICGSGDTQVNPANVSSRNTIKFELESTGVQIPATRTAAVADAGT